MDFPVSGVHCAAWLPPLAAFLIALCTAPAGVSGAFLLLPFQVSVLGFSGLSVTPTNLIYNVVATPGGVWRYLREGLMDWNLAWAIAAGSVPGIFAGAAIRIRWLADPLGLKAFAGCVLLYLGMRLVFGGARLSRPWRLSLVAFPVGIVGGIYGVGGGALLAPVAVAFASCPVRKIAGPSLFGTFLTSLAGVAAFEVAGASRPDWALGLLFGAGGLAGTYCGARMQKHLPERALRLLLGALALAVGLSYCGQLVVRLAAGGRL
jgi:uncharacterized membrane protein YfcA